MFSINRKGGEFINPWRGQGFCVFYAPGLTLWYVFHSKLLPIHLSSGVKVLKNLVRPSMQEKLRIKIKN